MHAHPGNHWTDQDIGCCHHPRKLPYAPSSQFRQREPTALWFLLAETSFACSSLLWLSRWKEGICLQKACVRMFIAALLRPWAGKTPNIPTPSEWINKLWSIHAMEHGWAMKRNWLWSHISAWRNHTDRQGFIHLLLLYCSVTDTFHSYGRGVAEGSCGGTHAVIAAVGDSLSKGWHPWSLMCKVPPIPAS